ncbi:MAG: RIP metalloprotease RseP [Candidatus Omnitrophica bacterium]|nr:RIP metalloprotease RseP [Candidatus Omnitrophota bacterium]
MSAIISIFILGILVIVHEAGHFVVARCAGVRVLRFSMGFGPRLLTWTRGHTEYAVSAIPLGGYVKMAGEQGEERQHQPWEYLSKPIATRGLIVFAGPFVNYLVALVSLWAVFVIGYPELLPVVGKLVPQMPAALAGLQPDDRIASVDGQPLASWEQMTKIIARSPERPLAFVIQRQQATFSVAITPKAKSLTDFLGQTKTVGQIGISPSGAFQSTRLAPFAAATRAVTQQNEWLQQTLMALLSMVTGRLSVRDSVTGPIGIVMLTSEAVKLGISPVLFLVSLFSLSLAVFNLFPIPILDGGHLLFLALEQLRGRPISLKVQERSAQVGFALLMSLVLVVCANDLSRLGVFDKVAGWFHR